MHHGQPNGSRAARSRARPNPSATLKFVIIGTDDQVEAQDALYDAIWSSCPTSDVPGGIPLLGCDVDEFMVDEENPDGGIWDGTARYGYSSQTDPQTTQYDFDTGGGTVHLTQAIATRIYGSDPDLASFGRLIGVQGDRASGFTVQGIDVPAPVFNWTETHYLPLAYINSHYEDVIADLTGKVNQAAFRSAKGKLWAPGSVLFQGCSGSERAGQDAAMSYKFAGSPNVTGITIGDFTGITKRGWEAVDVYTRLDPDSGLPAVVGVRVHQALEYGDFYRLGINV